MATLGNIQGASLVPDISGVTTGISNLQGRRREDAAAFDLQNQLNQALGLPGQEFTGPTGEGLLSQLTDRLPQRTDQGGGLLDRIGDMFKPSEAQQQQRDSGLSILGRISPEISQAATQVAQSGDPAAIEQFRTQATEAITFSEELRGQSFTDQQARIREEAAKAAAQGQDITKFAEMANMNEDRLGLELSRMQVSGTAALDAVPAFNPAEAFSVLSTPERAAAFAQVMAQNPQLGNSLLAGRERQITRQEQEAARQRAAAAASSRAAAAANRPQTDLGQELAGIQADIASGAIGPEVGQQLLDQARSGATAVDISAQQDAADLNKTQLGNQLLQQELDAAAGPPPIAAFDPESPQGKLIADRTNLVSVHGEGSPQVASFDRLSGTTAQSADLAAQQALQNIEETRLANQQAAAEQADPNSDLSAIEQQIQRIMVDQGVDRTTAQGVADGVFQVNTNPVTGDSEIINKATRTSFQPTAIGAELPPPLPLGITERAEVETGDPSRVFGATGFGINAVNTLTGAITGGSIDQATDQAKQALDNLNTRTMLAMSAQFPGRPSNLTRERIEALSPQPASIFTGKSRATTQLRQMQDLLAESIAGADRIQRGQGNFTPADRGEAAKAVEQLLPIWEDYSQILGKLDAGSGGGTVANIVNQAEFDALPKGSKFKLPDGTTGTK